MSIGRAKTDNRAKKLLGGWCILGLGTAAIMLTGGETALATSRFDINAGIAAATDPVVTALKAHWGKGVLLGGGAMALFGEGDLRQKAIKAAIGSGAAGAVMLGLIALLTN